MAKSKPTTKKVVKKEEEEVIENVSTTEATLEAEEVPTEVVDEPKSAPKKKEKVEFEVPDTHELLECEVIGEEQRHSGNTYLKISVDGVESFLNKKNVIENEGKIYVKKSV